MKSEVQSLSFMEKKRTVIILEKMLMKIWSMIKDSKYTSNKELLTIPGAVHTDLYDNLDVIPFDKIQKFFEENGVG